ASALNSRAARVREFCDRVRCLPFARGGTTELNSLLTLLLRDLKQQRLPSGPLASAREHMREALTQLADAGRAYRAAPHVAALTQLVAATEKIYTARKRRRAALDFTDLLVLARNLLRDQPTVCAEARARFEALLVDEFQDTNPVQAELVEQVAGPPGPG